MLLLAASVDTTGATARAIIVYGFGLGTSRFQSFLGTSLIVVHLQLLGHLLHVPSLLLQILAVPGTNSWSPKAIPIVTESISEDINKYTHKFCKFIHIKDENQMKRC